MAELDYSHGAFEFVFKVLDHMWFFSINPEMVPAAIGIHPSGRYFVYSIHPTNGSCHFYLEQNADYKWRSLAAPPFVTNLITELLGKAIENHYSLN